MKLFNPGSPAEAMQNIRKKKESTGTFPQMPP